MSKFRIPPFRWYRSLVVQGFAIFFLLLGYSHPGSYRLVWALGGYIFGLAAMTLGQWQNELEREWQSKLPKCPTCGRPQ